MEKVKTKKSKAPELVEGRTKEWNDIPERQYRSNQGRSPQKTEANYKVMFLGSNVNINKYKEYWITYQSFGRDLILIINMLLNYMDIN